MSSPYDPEFVAAQGGEQEQQQAEINDVLDNPREATPAQITSLLENASDEQKQELYKKLGVNITAFAGEILDRVENYKIGGKLIKEYPNFSRSEMISLIDSKKPKLEKLVEGWILENANNNNSGKPAIRFEDYYTTGSGAKLYINLITELADSRNWFERFMGIDPRGSGNNLAESLIEAAQRNSAAPDDPEDDEKKIDDISDAQAKQCILLNLLDPLSKLCDSQMFEKTNASNAEPDGYPYSGRIVKMNCDNPSTFINYLSSISGSNENLTDLIQENNTGLKETNLNYRLSFVRSYKNKLIELPIFYNGGFEYSTKDDELKIIPDPKLAIEIAANTTKFDIDVNYEGSNPSTYRSDVDVKITIAATNMTTFLKKWTYTNYIDEDNNDTKINFTLFDLILFPYLEKDSKGYGRSYKSQYSPSYNRLRLTYSNTFTQHAERPQKVVDFFNNNVNVLDLAIVDHEFKRDEEGKMHELVINYRGYVQSVLTSPETDILSTPDIKEKRNERDILLKEAIEKNCSLREIQKIQQQLNILARNDVQDISKSLMNSIYERGTDRDTMGLGIYKLGVTNSLMSKLIDDEGNVKLEEIKKLIINGQGNSVVADTSKTGEESSLVQNYNDFSAAMDEGTNNIYFFYLADLLDAAIINSDMFKNYDKKDDPNNPNIIVQKMRFLFGTFRGPPLNGDQKGKLYNLGNIPISVDYFLEWYEQNVTKKELYIYPCLSFIRDISETVITNMLNQFCYDLTEENKAVVRTSFFTGAKDDKGIEPLFSLMSSFYDERSDGKQISLSSKDKDKFPLIRPSFKKNVIDYVNYCAIFTRESRANAINLERNVEIINYKYDYPKPYYGPETIAFSRVSQQGLRESRYARNGGSGITMLAGVYNASIKLTHPLNFIYPGQFFQISLNEPQDFDINLPNGKSIGIFTELGLNGYYSVTKASHKISVSDKTNQVTIDGIWVGSKSPYENRQGSKKTDIEEATEAVCGEYVSLSEEIGVLEINPSFRLTDEITDINKPLDAVTSDRDEPPAPTPVSETNVEETIEMTDEEARERAIQILVESNPEPQPGTDAKNPSFGGVE